MLFIQSSLFFILYFLFSILNDFDGIFYKYTFYTFPSLRCSCAKSWG